jgi:acyl carrier protein
VTDPVAETIRQIIATQAMIPPDAVQLESSLQDLGLDSLGLVETIFAIEEAFDIAVPFNANDTDAGGFDISSVGSVVAAVRGLVAAKAT